MRIHRQRVARWNVALLVTIGLSCSTSGALLLADEPPPPSAPESPASKTAPHKGPRSITTDELAGPVEPFKAAKPETAKDKARNEALAWFMSGRRKEAESRFEEAINDYQAAIKLDPSAVEVYRALVPLEFALNRTEVGLQYAQKAIELDPQDLNILRLLAEQLQERRQMEKAAEYLDRASKSPKLKKDSGAYVLLELQLATLYVESKNLEKAADAYAIVFDARQNPAKYNLDFPTQSALERERLARFELMGEIFLLSKRTSLAVQAFEEAAKADHGKPLNFSLAQAYYSAKQYEPALKHLQTYLDAQLQGRGRRPYELLAEILKDMGKQSQILTRVEELAKKDPRNSTLQYFLADQYVAANRTKEAEEIIQRTLKESADPEGHLELAILYRKRNEPERMLDALAKSFKVLRDPQDPRARRFERFIAEIQQDAPLIDQLIAAGRKLHAAAGSKSDFFADYIVGRLALQNEKIDAAVEFYTKAMELRGESSGILAKELALHLADLKKYEQAANVLKKVLAGTWNPAGPQGELLRIELLLLLSRAQEFAGKTEEAVASIREAQKESKKVDAEDPEPEYWEAWIYSHSHQWDKAIHIYEELIRKSSASEKSDREGSEKDKSKFVRLCQFSLSNCYVQKGDIAKGEKILESVLSETPDDPSVNNDLGYLYADQGKHLERAEKMIRISLKSEPKNVAYLDSMGWVLFKLGRYQEARTFLEKAVASPTGSDATIYEHLGDCDQRLKALDKAVDSWKKALKDAQADTFPDATLIRRLQEKLKANGSEAKK